MSKAVNAIIVGLTVFILLTGSIWYVTVARGPNKVSAVEVEQGWESVNETKSVLWGQVTFRNPYDFRIDLTSFSYEFWVNEQRWVHNNSTDEVRLDPRGEAILPARIEMNTTEMDDWFQDHIARGERTTVWFTGNATFRVGGGELSVPFEQRQTWETGLRRHLEEVRNCPQEEPLPCIADASVKWVLDDDTMLLQLVFTIRNNNLDEMTISNRSAVLALGGIPIAGTNATDKVAIARQSGRFFEFPLLVDRSKVLDWWMHHAQECERSDSTLDLVFDYEVKAKPFPPQPTLPPTTTPPTTSIPPPTTTTSSPPPTTTATTTTSSPPPTTTATTTTSSPPPTTATTSSPPPTTTTTTTTSSPPPTTTTTSPPPSTSTSAPPPPPAPVANLTVNASGGSVPLDVSFGIGDDSGTSQTNLAWTLNFGDGNSTSGTTLPATAPHTYLAPGTYQAVLTMSSDAGESTDGTTITADPTPTTEATTAAASGPATGGEPSSTSEPAQSWYVGFRKAFEYPWRATGLDLGILEPTPEANGRPTTNGVERIAWDLELGEFRTGFACSLES